MKFQILIHIYINIQITLGGLIKSGPKTVEIKSEKTGEVIKVPKKEGIQPPTLLSCDNSGKATGVATSEIQVFISFYSISVKILIVSDILTEFLVYRYF